MKVIDNTTVESRPIKWILDEFRKQNLYIDDSFQRNYVWLNKDRISLIETILLGYSIPEIYLWETDTNAATGDTRYSIIDGQQRIRTINQFMAGGLKLTDSGLEFKNPDYRRKEFDDLGDSYKKDFWSYKVSVRFVNKNVQREEIIKMFLRLNKTSNALNPQELRHAEFHGQFISASFEIASLPHWREWETFTDLEIRRMSDIQFASTLLIYIRSGFEDETTQSSINKFYDLLNEKYPGKKQDIAATKDTLDYIREITSESPDLGTALQKKTHAYTIFTLSNHLLNIKHPVSGVGKMLEAWYEWHDQKVAPPQHYKDLVTEYRRLAGSGVQKKTNRQRRFEILCAYLKV
ncbi:MULTISPECIES: DUF262 domain-containing protein [Pseudomonas]|uniref:DUF262 domain-containing protein n=1 Tax=Pseudomonas TaxID=286 RepID=UPI0009D90761|nr:MULTISPECIES: DUF262 domain-containing protein [Pseudomonas]MBH3397158.1 DUF262 domain-containing protein [Pseudomonas monteilii]SMD17459.1 Protein of unknown function DUF262 [Pseudomonas sp. URIL14HWK12:I5]